MLLNQCGAETTIEDSMEGSYSVFVYSYLTKRKAEFDAEELEESDEGLGDEKVKIDEREADKALLEEHEWDMDGSDGLEYHSSTNSDHSSVDLKSNARKRKAEFEFEEEEEEESDDEEEGVDDGRGKIEEEPEARIDYLKAPEWDVDSFDGLEYYSSPEPILSSDEELFTEEEMEHYRIFKRQMIESKGFYGDRELRPSFHFKGISPMKLEQRALPNQNYRQFWQEMVYVCLQKLNQDKHSNVEFVEVVRGYYRPGPRSKSYITFMAREKPDGPLVEYQAKCMVTLDRKRHPILCRPAPTPMP
ncbi:PREDICTED: uncharacterized protein LOC104715488 [Camelina sativa]|uniref:Uncharacterized protein LOC104715488 n=1 Tax=Camelina sativa TaxID=90675 RepID=A0ABM0TTM1_CAMSA|nr:PREDICTED: uncharacterized protein LOC104715488 [Camelina sativa]XP_010431200.1 PREDICTED: uncharacterized protein LOC104715488 [Camelina sativa]XP_010431205.1 PREDICTED: uncharacterized protein LOC104715488 [Camelina sativa]